MSLPETYKVQSITCCANCIHSLIFMPGTHHCGKTTGPWAQVVVVPAGVCDEWKECNDGY